jgi:hypothetical protein
MYLGGIAMEKGQKKPVRAHQSFFSYVTEQLNDKSQYSVMLLGRPQLICPLRRYQSCLILYKNL